MACIIIKLASRYNPSTRFYDPPGTLRITISYLGFDRLVEAAFEQIRSYSKADVAVSLRLMRAFTDITMTMTSDENRQLMVDLGRRLLAGFIEAPGEDVLGEMKKRMTALERLASYNVESVV